MKLVLLLLLPMVISASEHREKKQFGWLFGTNDAEERPPPQRRPKPFIQPQFSRRPVVKPLPADRADRRLQPSFRGPTNYNQQDEAAAAEFSSRKLLMPVIISSYSSTNIQGNGKTDKIEPIGQENDITGDLETQDDLKRDEDDLADTQATQPVNNALSEPSQLRPNPSTGSQGEDLDLLDLEDTSPYLPSIPSSFDRDNQAISPKERYQLIVQDTRVNLNEDNIENFVGLEEEFEKLVEDDIVGSVINDKDDLENVLDDEQVADIDQLAAPVSDIRPVSGQFNGNIPPPRPIGPIGPPRPLRPQRPNGPPRGQGLGQVPTRPITAHESEEESSIFDFIPFLKKKPNKTAKPTNPSRNSGKPVFPPKRFPLIPPSQTQIPVNPEENTITVENSESSTPVVAADIVSSNDTARIDTEPEPFIVTGQQIPSNPNFNNQNYPQPHPQGFRRPNLSPQTRPLQHNQPRPARPNLPVNRNQTPFLPPRPLQTPPSHDDHVDLPPHLRQQHHQHSQLQQHQKGPQERNSQIQQFQEPQRQQQPLKQPYPFVRPNNLNSNPETPGPVPTDSVAEIAGAGTDFAAHLSSLLTSFFTTTPSPLPPVPSLPTLVEDTVFSDVFKGFGRERQAVPPTGVSVQPRRPANTDSSSVFSTVSPAVSSDLSPAVSSAVSPTVSSSLSPSEIATTANLPGTETTIDQTDEETTTTAFRDIAFAAQDTTVLQEDTPATVKDTFSTVKDTTDAVSDTTESVTGAEAEESKSTASYPYNLRPLNLNNIARNKPTLRPRTVQQQPFRQQPTTFRPQQSVFRRLPTTTLSPAVQEVVDEYTNGFQVGTEDQSVLQTMKKNFEQKKNIFAQFVNIEQEDAPFLPNSDISGSDWTKMKPYALRFMTAPNLGSAQPRTTTQDPTTERSSLPPADLPNPNTPNFPSERNAEGGFKPMLPRTK